MFNFFTSVHNHAREFLRISSSCLSKLKLRNLQQTVTAKIAGGHQNYNMVYWKQQAPLPSACTKSI